MYWSILEAISRDLDRASGADRCARETEQASSPIPVNLHQGEDVVTVTAELPGVASEDINVTVDDGILSLAADRKPVELGDQETTVLQEHGHGKRVRRIRLPFPVDAAEISASMQHGLLRITLPKRADAKPRRIDVAAG